MDPGSPATSSRRLRVPIRRWALQRYILTVFGYGCNLGPVQTARHAGIASADTLRLLNAQHIDMAKLEAAMIPT